MKKNIISTLAIAALISNSVVAKSPKCPNSGDFSAKNSQWPRWGHDNINSFANLQETKITKDNVSSLRQLWNFELPADDFLNTSPIVVNDLVYFLSGAGKLYVLDAATGTFSPAFNGGQPLFVGANAGSNAGSTPAIYRDFIFTATDDMRVKSFNRLTGAPNPSWPDNGTAIPVYPANDPVALSQASITTSVTIVNDGQNELLFIATSSTEETSVPVKTLKGTINAYDLTTGSLIWSQVIAGANNDAIGTGAWSTPSFDIKNKLMFFGTSNPQQVPAGELSDALQARNYLTGELVWNQQFVSNDVSSFEYPYGIGNPVYLVDKDIGASPNVIDVCCAHKEAKHLVGVNGKNSIYKAFDRVSGNLEWEAVLTNNSSVLSNASAAYANGVIYTSAAIDIDPATAIPNPPFSAIYGNVYATPAVLYSDVILATAYGDFDAFLRFLNGILTSNNVITALDACTGKVLWSNTFPTIAFGAPVYANGVLYVGTYDGFIRALDAHNGAVLATYTTPLSPDFGLPQPKNLTIPASFAVTDGKIFVPYENLFGGGNAGVIAFGV